MNDDFELVIKDDRTIFNLTIQICSISPRESFFENRDLNLNLDNRFDLTLRIDYF